MNLQQMFNYAKNIADNCEYSSILFLVTTHEDLVGLSPELTNKRLNLYESKGFLKVGVDYEDMEETNKRYGQYQWTHLFLQKYISGYMLLKSRVGRTQNSARLKEPIGIYFPHYVERIERYA